MVKRARCCILPLLRHASLGDLSDSPGIASASPRGRVGYDTRF
jgi:hypothetical protein